MGLIDRLRGNDGPIIERVRYEPKIRRLEVIAIDDVTPAMRRITFAGPDLADFRSLGFDDHIKILLDGGAERRDFTPRRHDRAAGTLAVDFALHEGGSASSWARGARVGDRLEIGGPKGSQIIAREVREWLLIGDETALPAIGRRIEEADAHTRITAVVAIAGTTEEQQLATRADARILWAHRPLSDAADPSALLSIIRTLQLAPGTFIWVAAEAGVARSIRDHLLDERNVPRGWLKAGGYWVAGRANAHEKLG